MNHSTWQRSSIGVLQILGGAWLMIYGAAGGIMLFSAVVEDVSLLLNAALAVLGGGLSLIAGIALLRRLRFGYWLSLALQVAQIPLVDLAALQYKFYAGTSLYLWVAPPSDFDLAFDVGGVFKLGATPEIDQASFGINLVALALAFALIHYFGATPRRT